MNEETTLVFITSVRQSTRKSLGHFVQTSETMYALLSSGRSGPRKAQLYQLDRLRASHRSYAKQSRSRIQRQQRSVLHKRLR